MYLFKQLLIIFAVCFVGECAAQFLPLPSGIVGLLLLFILLLTKAIRPSQIDIAGDFVLRNMAIFFLPSTVGIMQYFSVLAENWLPFAVIVVVSLIVTFAVTALTVTLLIKALSGRRVRR